MGVILEVEEMMVEMEAAAVLDVEVADAEVADVEGTERETNVDGDMFD